MRITHKTHIDDSNYILVEHATNKAPVILHATLRQYFNRPDFNPTGVGRTGRVSESRAGSMVLISEIPLEHRVEHTTIQNDCVDTYRYRARLCPLAPNSEGVISNCCGNGKISETCN